MILDGSVLLMKNQKNCDIINNRFSIKSLPWTGTGKETLSCFRIALLGPREAEWGKMPQESYRQLILPNTKTWFRLKGDNGRL